MNLFFNTAMTHRPAVGSELDYKSEDAPRLLALALIQTDIKGEVVQAEKLYIQQEIDITNKIELFSHVSQLDCDSGVPLVEALDTFRKLCQSSNRLIAFNYTYAMLPIKAEFWWMFNKEPNFRRLLTQSVMKMVTDTVALPGKFNKPKWPRLDEAYSHFFKAPLRTRPDVLFDLEATYQIYFKHLYGSDLPSPSANG